MASLEKRWLVQPRMPADVESSLAKVPPILRQTLYNQGITNPVDAETFLNALPLPGTQPEDMLGIPAAVERIVYAVQHGESIVVYGDYDADGVTATALLTHALKALGAAVTPYIPNRFDEGYGLNLDALAALKAAGHHLVITVDCGIRSVEEAEYARKLGIDLIISDHHHPGAELPPALAVINPKQSSDTYPEKDLAGVGLAYKLALALIERLGPDRIDPESYLDLVAIGTVADLAPLQGENRALVRRGMQWLRHAQRQGLRSLMGVAGIKPLSLSTGDIGFGIGPRLNAAGRLESAQAALELLLTDDVRTAGSLAQQLDNQNRDRQKLTREIQLAAEQIALEHDPDSPLLFAAHEDFNPGVVGLAASRLTEAYYRPAIVAHRTPETTRGSCRSIPEFHITAALDECADLLVRHGGHKAAAGFTVLNQNLPELIERLRQIAARELAGKDLRPVLRIEQEVGFPMLNNAAYEALNLLEPTGYGNPRPVFMTPDLMVIRAYTVGKEGDHLRMSVTDGRLTFDAIGFRFGHWAANMPRHVDLAYTFELNEHNGRLNFQLNLRDMRPA